MANDHDVNPPSTDPSPTSSPAHNMATKSDEKTPIGALIALYSYGFFNWCMFLLLGLIQGGFKQPEEQYFLQKAVAHDQFWNLSKQPLPGFYHAFQKLRSGKQLHYIHNRGRNAPKGPSDLCVFIHGFPDSAMMWRHLLKEPTLPTDIAALVCVDMPGFGGSDSFDTYDCTVLEALSEFIVAMREKYTQTADGVTQGKTYVLGHDWGCVLTFRLAAEAPGLADRFFTTNGPLVDHARANAFRTLGSAAKIFKQFRSAPTQNISLLGKILKVMKPLLYQIWLSGYITVFRLPGPFITLLGGAGNMFLLRAIAEMEHGKEEGKPNIPEYIGSLRPGPAECSTSVPETKNTYGASVLTRAQNDGLAFLHMTAYYRDGLSWRTWDKSLETVTDLYNIDNDTSGPDATQKRRSSSASSAMFSDQYKGSLRAPTTLLWGNDDKALSKAMCLDGIGDYLAKESEVILLPRSGHWTAIEKESRQAWAQIIRTFVERNQGKSTVASHSVIDDVKKVYPGATVVIKR